MKKSDNFLRILLAVIFLGLGAWYALKFGAPNTLKLYIRTGIGDCRKIPLLCMSPTKKVVVDQINKECLRESLTYSFSKIKICLPRGFNVTYELTRKAYYKKKISKRNDSFAYLLYEEPRFFIELFPQAKRAGVNNNYDFIKRVMYAKIEDIKGINDAFFVIMKSIFIPDMGDQRQMKMLEIQMPDKKGFLNYNIGKGEDFFECDLVNDKDEFFKIYIKDKTGQLNLEKVIALISSMGRP